MRPLPSNVRINVPAGIAGELAGAALALPARENEAYYDLALQDEAMQGLHSACPEGMRWLRGEIQARLDRAPHCATIQGLQFDQENRLFVGLSRALGRLVSRPLQKPRAQLVHYIHHQQDITAKNGGRVYTELFHTDGADWPRQIDIVSMVCVHPDPRGQGRSRLLDIDAVRSAIRALHGEAVLGVLETEPVPWLLGEGFDEGVVWRPVLGQETMCWRRYTINYALDHLGIRLPEHVSTALDAMGQTLETCETAWEWLMEAGELLIVDNHRCLHARGPVRRDLPSDRLMLRSWIHRAN
ncbi:MAG: TauD/TfdA family dioxygenase [Pseudomonadota bacterium]